MNNDNNVITVTRSLDELKVMVKTQSADCASLQGNKTDANKIASDAIKTAKAVLKDTVEQIATLVDPLPVLISLVRDIVGGGDATERSRADRQRKAIAEAANAICGFTHNGFTYNVELVNLGSAKSPVFTLEYIESAAIPPHESLKDFIENHCKSKKYSLTVQYLALQELVKAVEKQLYASNEALNRKAAAIAAQKAQTAPTTPTTQDTDTDIV